MGFLKIIAVVGLLSSAVHAAELSSFADVHQVLMDESVPLVSDRVVSELEVYRSGRLPHYAMNISSVFQYGSAALEKAALRTVNDKSDFYDRLPKLLHPNGVCLTGEWEIYLGSPYTGAFAAGTKNLFVGRVSVAMQETTNDYKRGFGFAGKLFPTMNSAEKVATENFFSVDVLMGTHAVSFLDTATTNEPEVGFDLWLVRLGLKIASALKKADENPGFRPVKNLASMGVEPGTPVRVPHWVRFSAAPSMKKNRLSDFRDEVVQAVHDNGELVFYVDVSETTSDRTARSGWQRIGEIRAKEAMVSYGCDRRLHFAHPKLK